jgi:predicted nucleic acid-binding Zn ribbon protein
VKQKYLKNRRKTADVGMEKLGPLVKNVISGLGLQKRVDEYRVVEEWEKIVGKTIADRVVPLTVDRGRLLVEVHSSSWLMEMKMRERDILRKIEGQVGEGIIREIRFIGK